MKISRLFTAIAGVAVSATILAGCATTPTETATPSPTPTETVDGVVQVVTSTNVYASIAKFIGGDDVAVEAIITDPSQDPHSYEASARDQLLVSEADLVISNGGGYDDFMQTMLAAIDNPPFQLEAVAESHETGGDDDSAEHSHDNEHIWYDFDEMGHFADHLAETLSTIKPTAAEKFADNLEVFLIEIENLTTRSEALSERVIGQGLTVVALEPVAERLLDFAGFEDLTPAELRDAIEEEREIPLAALQQVEQQLAAGEVSLLVANLQVIDTQMQQLVSAAEAAGVPVLTMSELVPAEVASGDYLDWMNLNIDRLQELFY
jgi:zinc/manganese transport system substrate-binding protein